MLRHPRPRISGRNHHTHEISLCANGPTLSASNHRSKSSGAHAAPNGPGTIPHEDVAQPPSAHLPIPIGHAKPRLPEAKRKPVRVRWLRLQFAAAVALLRAAVFPAELRHLPVAQEPAYKPPREAVAQVAEHKRPAAQRIQPKGRSPPSIQKAELIFS